MMQPKSEHPGVVTLSSTPQTSTAELNVPWYENPTVSVASNAISALAAAVSAYMAYRAVRATLEAMGEARESRLVSKKEDYFARYVTERAVPAVEEFTEQALACIDSCLHKLDSIDRSKPFGQIVDVTQEAADKFYTSVSTLRGHLFFITAAWPDSSLWSDLDAQLLKLEDEGMARINSLVAEDSRNEGIENLVRQRSAELLRYMFKYDESAHQVITTPVNGPVKKFRKKLGDIIRGDE